MLDSAFCTLRRLVGCSLAEEMWSHLVHNFHWTVVEIWSWLHQFSGLPLHSQTSQNLPKERKQNHHHTRSYLLWEWTVINHKHNDAALMQPSCSTHAAASCTRFKTRVLRSSKSICHNLSLGRTSLRWCCLYTSNKNETYQKGNNINRGKSR